MVFASLGTIQELLDKQVETMIYTHVLKRGGKVIEEEHMERAVPQLPADDLGIAKDFYVNKLGFGIAFEATNDGRQGLLGLARGTIQITVDSPMDGHGRNACVALEVNDADAYYDEWSKKVTVMRPPHNEAWGARTFDLLDPFGNTIFVMGPTR